MIKSARTLASEDNLAALGDILKSCRLCAHSCGVDRTSGEKSLNYCKSGAEAEVSSVNIHFGEEPPISGTRGSGTIFFANCSLECAFCQNYPISALGNGRPFSARKLADAMKELEARGAHNINLVSPTHYAPQAAEAVALARKDGLDLPIVYNTGGYDSVEALRLLEGTVDIYMPDMKYASDDTAVRYSGADGYVAANRAAVKEMRRQVGDLEISPDGAALKGLLVRHLILPGLAGESKQILDFIARELSVETRVSLMSQYHPAHRADKYAELSRRITTREYGEVIEHAEKLGLENVYIQYL